MKALAIGLVFVPTVALGAPDKAEADREWQAIQACQAVVRMQLHDKGSAEFPGISRSYRKLQGNVYTVQIEVLAKNAFNAKRQAVFECKVDAKSMVPKSAKQVR